MCVIQHTLYHIYQSHRPLSKTVSRDFRLRRRLQKRLQKPFDILFVRFVILSIALERRKYCEIELLITLVMVRSPSLD